MSAALVLAERRWFSGALALLVHLAFVLLMVFAVSWQNTPGPVEAELWASLPPTPSVPVPPRPQPPPEPALVPKREPVQPDPKLIRKAEPKAPPKPETKPDIAVEKERQRKEAEQRKAEQEQKARDEQARREKEQADQARRQDEERREREAREAAEKQAAAQAAQAAKQASALNEWKAKVVQKVRGNIRGIAGLQGSEFVELRVVQLPSGDVVDIRVTRPSGKPEYDEAVQRAVRMSSPLPMPEDLELRRKVREFPIGFRPGDLFSP